MSSYSYPLSARSLSASSCRQATFRVSLRLPEPERPARKQLDHTTARVVADTSAVHTGSNRQMEAFVLSGAQKYSRVGRSVLYITLRNTVYMTDFCPVCRTILSCKNRLSNLARSSIIVLNKLGLAHFHRKLPGRTFTDQQKVYVCDF